MPSLEEHLRPPRTELVFLLAPGVATLTGCAAVDAVVCAKGQLGHFGEAVLRGSDLVCWVGLVGDLSAVLFALPLYCLLPERARGDIFAVSLPAGASAAAPWLLLSLAFGAFGLIAAAIACVPGCIGGVAFALIRGASPDPAGGGAS